MWGIWMMDPPLPLHPLPLSLLSVTCWGGGEGSAGWASLNEVITAYQWQQGGWPSDLWSDASGVKSSKSWPLRWDRVLFCHPRILYLFQTHFMSAAVGAAALALSSSVLFHCHMAAEKLQYMFQISPWGVRLTSVTNPPNLPATHSSSHLFHILHRMWVTRICINYTVWAIYWEIKGWYLQDLAQWSYNNISLPLMIKYSTLKGEEERTVFKRKQVCFVLQLSTVNISVRLVLHSERQNVRGEKKGQLFWSTLFKMIKWSWHHTESHCGWSGRLQTFTILKLWPVVFLSLFVDCWR